MRKKLITLAAVAVVMALAIPAQATYYGTYKTNQTINKGVSIQCSAPTPRVAIESRTYGFLMYDSTGSVQFAISPKNNSNVYGASWAESEMDHRWHRWVTPYGSADWISWAHLHVSNIGNAELYAFCTGQASGRYRGSF